MNKWPRYFMNIAKETAALSRDPVTKVGAVLTKNKYIKSNNIITYKIYCWVLHII